ncbi:MAG TPA: hypothetical protein VGL77_09970 [Armatimonadota bacterium]|jgi:hypothetical protein
MGKFTLTSWKQLTIATLVVVVVIFGWQFIAQFVNSMRHPHLPMVMHRVLPPNHRLLSFTIAGYPTYASIGYPQIEFLNSNETEPVAEMHSFCWLDAQGQRTSRWYTLPNDAFINVSPHGQYASLIDTSSHLWVAQRGAMPQQVPGVSFDLYRNGDVNEPFPIVLSVTDFGATKYRGSAPYFMPTGATVAFPAGWTTAPWPANVSTNPRYFLLQKVAPPEVTEVVGLYDQKTNSIKSSAPLKTHMAIANDFGALFVQASRSLFVFGVEAIVFDDSRFMARFGVNPEAFLFKGLHIPREVWLFGDDGSTWTYDQQAVKILAWHTGKPHLVHIPFQGVSDAGSAALQVNTDAVAVWGDGRLVAQSQAAYIPKNRLTSFLTGKSSVVGIANARQLILYRDGQPVDQYTVRIRDLHDGLDAGSIKNELAFSLDGRYLAWRIGQAPVSVGGKERDIASDFFVFRVK